MIGFRLATFGLALCFTLHAQAEEPAATTTEEPDTAGTEEPAPGASDASESASKSAAGASFLSPYRSLSDQELTYEYEHTSLGGPIALAVVGGVISALALPTFLVSGIGSLVCAANSIGDCTPVDTVTVVSGASTAVFGAMMVVGVVLLHNGSQKRTALKNEMWRRQSEGASLTLGLSPTRGGTLLAIGGRF